MKCPTTDQCCKKKSTRALVFWTPGLVTHPMSVNLFSLIRELGFSAGMTTRLRRDCLFEREILFPFSDLEYLCAIWLD